MTRPGLMVEFAPGYTPFDASPTWVDVSARVIEVSYSDGRQAGLQAYPPAEATIVMGNEDRLFDPEYESGTYVGQLVPRVPFRVRAVSAGPTYRTLFYGFVEGGWEQDWRPPGDMICTVTLVDWLGVLASYRLDDYLDDYVFAHDVIAWWRFDETRNTTEVVDRSGNDHHGTATAAVQGEAGLTPGAGRSIFFPRAIDPSINAIVEVPITAPLVLEPPFTVCWVSRLPPHGTDGVGPYNVMQQYKASNNAGVGIFFNSNVNVTGTAVGSTEHGMLVALMNDGTARREIVRGESTFDDGVARFYAVVVPTWNAADWEIYSAAQAAGVITSSTVLLSSTGTLPPVGTPDRMEIGNTSGLVSGADRGLNGNLDHLMVFDEALSSPDFTTLNAAIWDYNGGQSTGDGVDWVLDRIGVPAAFRDIDTGDEMLGVTTEFGALERLRGIEAVERGALFVDHEAGGVIRFRSASSLAADTRITTSQHTFSDEDAGGVFHYERDGLVIEANGVDSIVNRQAVEWAGGTVTVQDDDSIDAYGPREGRTLLAPAEDYAAAKAIGEAIVLVNKEPKTRVRSLKFDAGADDSNFDLLLDLQPRDKETLERRPLAIGDPIIQDVYYEGGKYAIGPGMRWEGQLFLSTIPKTPVGAEVALRWDVGAPVAGVSFIDAVVHGRSAFFSPFPKTVTAPSGRAAGDLLLAFLGADTWVPTTPTGWTQRSSTTGESYTMRVYSRTATGNASDDFVVNRASGAGSDGNIYIAALRGSGTTITGSGMVMDPWADNSPLSVATGNPTAPGAGLVLVVAIITNASNPATLNIDVPAGLSTFDSERSNGQAGSSGTIASLFAIPAAGAGAVGATTVTAQAGSTSAIFFVDKLVVT